LRSLSRQHYQTLTDEDATNKLDEVIAIKQARLSCRRDSQIRILSRIARYKSIWISGHHQSLSNRFAREGFVKGAVITVTEGQAGTLRKHPVLY
jgi:hypothetical protein